MNVFEAVRQTVTTRQAAEMYGIHVNRNGMAVCPFHNDKNPSMKVDMDALTAMREYLETDEAELQDMTEAVLEKLDAMTDAEFETLDLFPDFSEEDADGE